MPIKTAARYATQPTLPSSQGSLSGAFPWRRSLLPSLNSLAPAGQPAQPNPLANVSPGTPGLANTQGVQQAMQKLAELALLEFFKRAETQVSGAPAAANKSPSLPMQGGVTGTTSGAKPALTQAANRPGTAPAGNASSATAGSSLQTRNLLGGQSGMINPVMGGWSRLYPGSPVPKMAMATANAGGLPPAPGGATSMPPAPPPGAPAQQPAQPPQATVVQQAMGAASSAQPPAQPAPPGQPGQPPVGPGGVPLPVPPMAEAMPAPLPANPPMPPPQTLSPDHAAGSMALDNALGLAQMDGNDGESMNAGLLATDAKTAMARFLKSTFKEAEGDDDTLGVYRGTPMRGWQWKALNKSVDDASTSWMPRLFKTQETPITDLLASPGKQGVLHSLLGGALGGAAGYGLDQHFNQGSMGWQGPALGAGAGALLGGLMGYSRRRKENDKVVDALRRLPPGATVRDYDALQEQDEKQAILKSTFKEAALISVEEVLACAKHAAQDNAQPAVSATGESKGLSYAHKEDDYYQGQKAWASASNYLKKKPRIDPDPFKGRHKSGMAPCAEGFITYCARQGLSSQQIDALLIKAAQQFPEAAQELRSGLTKQAANYLGGFGRASKVITPATKAVAPVAKAAPAAAHAAAPAARSWLSPQLKAQLLPTAAGSVAGGFAGDDAGLPGYHLNDVIPGLQHVPVANQLLGGLNVTGMALGGAAFNPSLRRFMGRRPGPDGGMLAQGRYWGGHPAMQAVRNSAVGGFGGSMLDAALGTVDPETGRGRFGQLGALGGLGLGATRGLGQNMRRSFAAGSTARNVGKMLDNPVRAMMGQRGVGGFGSSAGEGMLSSLSYPFRRAYHSMSGATGPAPTWFTAGPRNMAQTLGRGAGMLGVGSMVAGLGNQWLSNRAKQLGEEATAHVLPQAMPYLEGHAQNFINNYLAQHGLLSPNGQINTTGMLSQAAGAGMDRLFHGLGLDPARLSGLQKLMILGSAGVGGAGLLAGSPVLAGAGGAGALLSLLPYLTQGNTTGNVQGGAPPPSAGVEQRNELELQRQRYNG